MMNTTILEQYYKSLNIPRDCKEFLLYGQNVTEISRGLELGANVNFFFVNTKGIEDPTPLIFACMCKNYDITKFLLENGANPNLSTNSNNALHIVTHTDDFDFFELMVQYGANINQIDSKQNTPLIIASNYGYKDIVDFLLEQNVNIEHRNNFGETALFVACKNNKIDIVNTLISHGANVHIKNHGEINLLMTVAEQIGDMIQLFDTLILAGLIEFDLQNNAGQTALILACENNNFFIAERLIQLNCDVNLKTKKGYDALSRALKNSNLQLIKLLIEHGAYIALNIQYNRNFIMTKKEIKNYLLEQIK